MSVGKEKNGTYAVQCWYREQLTGERRKKTKRSFKRKSDAVRWEHDFLMKAAGSPTMKFADYCDVYRSDMLPRLKRNTWRTKGYIIRDKFLPYSPRHQIPRANPATAFSARAAAWPRRKSRTLRHRSPWHCNKGRKPRALCGPSASKS